MREESKKSSGNGWLIEISILLFRKFINILSSEFSTLTILFNMIIYLAIIILVMKKM